ncbi:MAG TPA: hypothetical protein VFX97_11475 [Pyrinomonadaceae bacterium]|nr:hypothetical protein [Pyrinomonadaceae bacterium]
MIKRALSFFFILVTASLAAGQTTPAPSPTATPTPARPAAPKTHLKVGDAAPDFNLPSTIIGADNRSVRYKLSDLKGKKNVVLAFYVLAFTGG